MSEDVSTLCCSFVRLASFWQCEPVLYTSLVLLYLVPVWVFRYVPTQDGPAHLANALILKDYGTAHSRYQEFFELCWEPFPNWTTHLLLAGLLYAFPPLVAHKVLVSLYVVGFAFSFRYFLAAFGRETVLLAPTGLLFVYNCCFLTGFYNYCLSLILFWIILGYCLRRRQSFGLEDAVLLMVCFWLAYFTHQLGYLLAGAGAAWILAISPPQRLRKLGCLALALLPTAWLAAAMSLERGVLGLRENLDQGLPRLGLHLSSEQWWEDVQAINQGLFEPYEAWNLPLGVLVLIFYEAVLLALVLAPRRKPETADPAPPRLPVALFGGGIGVLYLLLPDFLSVAIGFLKARLILLPPLLGLACLRPPQPGTVRRALTGFLYLLLAVNLVLVTRYCYSANQELAEYTAGLGYAGRQRNLFVMQTRTAPSGRATWSMRPIITA